MPATMIKTVRLSWLQTLIALHECGDQISAGKFLGCSQTTVSTEIVQLENWLGREVLSRPSRRGLTNDAKAMVPIFREIVSELFAARVLNIPPCDMSLVWLQAFQGVIEHGSQKAVAASLGWSKMTVGRYCDLLESWLGKKLLCKRRPPELTSFGKQFLDTAIRVWMLLSEMSEKVATHNPRVALSPKPKFPVR